MKIKLVLITDTHIADTAIDDDRRCDLAENFLTRAIYRLNRWIKPDAVLFLGDLVEDDGQESLPARLERVAGLLSNIECPYLVIPGNHDVPAERFYRIFPQPGDYLDVKGVRLASFVDPEAADYNARRREGDLDRMLALRQGHQGPIIACQHVALFPPGSVDSPFNLVNADDVIAVMRQVGISLSVGGHYHDGFGLIKDGGISFLGVPGLMKAPFQFVELDIDGDSIDVTRHCLRLPENRLLVDGHIHTPLACCNQNMDPGAVLQLAQALQMGGVAFAEHADHICLPDGLSEEDADLPANRTVPPSSARAEEYFAMLDQAGVSADSVGFEVEISGAGRLLIRPEERSRAAFIIGSVHAVPERKQSRPDYELFCQQFMAASQQLLGSGVRVLAHPWRVFRRSHLPVPEHLFAPMVAMLKEAGVGAEVNFHTNEPPAAFFKLCLEAGVKIAFGSDAHNMREPAELWPHVQLIRQIGFDGDLGDILLDPRFGA